MAKKHKCKKCPACPPGEKWAVPLADFFSLLLALFIALFAIASVNTEKMKALKEEFVKIYDYSPVSETIFPVIQMQPEADSTESDNTNHPQGQSMIKESGSAQSEEVPQEDIQSTISQIQELLAQTSSGGAQGPLDQVVDGVLLKLPASVQFTKGSHEVNNADMQLFIKRVAMITKALPSSINITIRGHANNFTGSLDALDLSSKRASAVLAELVKIGIDESRLSIAGFGATSPLAVEGKDLYKNDRVEFYIFMPSINKTNQKESKTILDILKDKNEKKKDL
ncbi:MAG: flagellar motor protein MotB [Sulfuricurvum sp.]